MKHFERKKNENFILNDHIVYVHFNGYIPIWRKFIGISLLQDESFHKKFGMEMPSLQTLFAQMSYLFVNANELVDYPRPISNKIIFIGGITPNENGQLPQVLISINKRIVNLSSTSTKEIWLQISIFKNSEQLEKKSKMEVSFRSSCHIFFVKSNPYFISIL